MSERRCSRFDDGLGAAHGAGSPNQESKLRYISIWEGALPLRGAVAPVINKTPIYSPVSPTADIQTALATGPVIIARIWTAHINHAIGNAMIRDAKLKQMRRVTLSARQLMRNHLQWGMKLNGTIDTHPNIQTKKEKNPAVIPNLTRLQPPLV